MSVSDYLDLDLSHGATAARDLFDRVQREAGRVSLSLTGDGDAGAVSANLTPEMSSWFGTHVAGRRQAALNAVEAAARRIRADRGNAEGVVAEIEEDRLKRERNSRRAEETRTFYDRHQSRVDGLNELQHEYDGLRTQEGGRDAQVPSRLVEFGLPLLVAVPEGFMNFGSFVTLTGLGVAGLGLTVVVGLGIGVSAYLAGKFWKAWHFYMRADEDDQQQRGLRMMGIASSLLSVSLAVIGYARYRTVSEKAMREVIMGLDPSNPLTATALLLTGNLLVFFVGAAITYMILDENPLFAEKAKRLDRDRAVFEALKRRELDDKVAEIDRAYKQRRDAMLKRARLMTTQSDYADIGENVGRINAKDQEVVGLLQTYRSHLVGAIENRAPEFRFAATAAERQGGTFAGSIGLSEFCAQPLHLYRGVR